MKNIFKSFMVPTIMGGLWGIIIYLFYSLILSNVPFSSFLFFPGLFGGIAGIFSISVSTGISLERAIIVGLLAGFSYSLLSPIFPFLASILIGVCIGAGLARNSGKSFNFFYRFIRLVKGILMFPIIIFSGNLVSQFFFSISNSSFIVCFIWGFLLFLAIYVTCAPFSDSYKSKGYRETYGSLDEFKRETREILQGIGRL
jgi:hypothetical protein